MINRIKKENKPETKITKNIKNLSAYTERNTIVYYSNLNNENNALNTNDINHIMKVIENLDVTKGVDLVLNTPGGEFDATESIINFIHGVFGEDIRAIIPQSAMSAGTLIACSCKEIYMGFPSSLGPTDPQIDNISAKNILKEFKLAKKEMAECPEHIPFWTTLLDKYSETMLIECEKALEWSEEILEKSLKYSMFKDDDDQKQIAKIKDALITSENIKNHCQTLSAKKCKEIGLKIKQLENDKKMYDLTYKLHQSVINYFIHTKKSKIIANQNGTYSIVD